jgi:3-methyl-2-oxobutanoate hydroxymethyltransferase
MADRGEKIVMLTTYDYPSSLLVEDSDIDIAFVGDSLAMTVLGLDSTTPVTLDEMLVFMRAVARGAHTPLLLGDLPFGAYTNPDLGVQSSVRVLKEGRMDAVKLEGGEEVADTVHAITRAGIPVMSHIGLTPQTSAAHGGFKVQGRRADQARKLVEDALALQDAGAFGIVLETIPAEVAEVISRRLRIPTIGIGSGAQCDGQVLVWHDMLGFSGGKYGRHAKQFADLNGAIRPALQQYAQEVRSGRFPGEDNVWHMAEEELQVFAATA